MILEDLAVGGVQLQIPLHALGVAHLDLVDVAAVFLFQLGLLDGRARMLGQGRGIELLEGLDGAGIAQLERLVRTEIAGLGGTGGSGDEGGGEQGSELYHGSVSLGASGFRQGLLKASPLN